MVGLGLFIGVMVAGGSETSSQTAFMQKARRAALRAEHPPAAFAGTPRKVVGLVSDPQVPGRLEQRFHATGHWVGQVGGQWYVVLAGARSAPATGTNLASAVVVFREPAEFNSGAESTLIGEYVAPGGSTEELRISAVEGDVLQLTAKSGRSFAFNLATDAFQ